MQGPRDRPRLSPKYQHNGVPISSFFSPIPMISSFFSPIHGPGLIHSNLNQTYSNQRPPDRHRDTCLLTPTPRRRPGLVSTQLTLAPAVGMPHTDLGLFSSSPSPGCPARPGACSPGKTRLSRDDFHKRPRTARLRHWFSKIASVLNLKAREPRPVHHQGRGTGPSTEERRRAASLIPPRAYNAVASFPPKPERIHPLECG